MRAVKTFILQHVPLHIKNVIGADVFAFVNVKFIIHSSPDNVGEGIVCSGCPLERSFVHSSGQICYHHFSPRECEGICFYRRWFVCLSVTTITKTIVDRFVQ